MLGADRHSQARYRSFASAVSYVEHLKVESPQPVSRQRLEQLADVVFEAAKWSDNHSKYDYPVDPDCPLFKLLAYNLPSVGTLPQRNDMRLRHIRTELRALGFKD